MSSPGSFTPVTPPTPPPMQPMPPYPPPRRHRSFAGPFVLIVLGVVCLLATSHVLSISRLHHLFANYWPLLLILWGVIKLVEYQQAQREGYRPAGIGAGGVLLIIAIVVAGLIATSVERFNWKEVGSNLGIEDSDFDNLFGHKYNFDDHLEQDFPAGASLKVFDTGGAVSIHASDDNKISVVVRKRVGADNQSDADKYNNETKPTITVIGGLVTLDAKQQVGDHHVETDLDISLPRKAPATITARGGDVVVTGRDGNIDISAQHSDTSVEDVTGNVKVSQEKGSVKIEQITGDVHVEGRVDEVEVSDIKGAAQLDGEFQESVKLARITKNVSFKSTRTDMEFARIDGDLDLDSDDLRGAEIAGPVHLTTRSKNIHLDGVTGDVRLQDNNGEVELAMRTLGNVQIDNRSGDVRLNVPEKAGFRLDARTRDGEIQAEFPELKVENNDRESHASGTVGNGASHIVVNNEHSGIEIRRGSAQPPKPPEPAKLAAPAKPAKNLPAPKQDVEPEEN
jgi:DUF4097 and DUF4098 domain-containing protein YvlB